MSNENDYTMILKNVRISFPHLHQRSVVNGEVGKYGAISCLDPATQQDQIDKAEALIEECRKAHPKLKSRKLAPDKLCLRSGEFSKYENMQAFMTLNANSDEAPVILDKAKRRVTKAEDCEIFAGCRVNVKVRFWAQDNKFGQRINAQLIAVQFVAEDESFVSTRVSEEEAMEGFDELEPTEIDDDVDF